MTLRQRSRMPIGFLVITILVAATQSAAQCSNTNDAGAPCFMGNPDILGGRASLLQDDDLVFNTSVYFSGAETTPGGGSLLTSNSTITQTSPTQITNANSNNFLLSNTITIRGRLFDINHDQILSAALVQNPGGQKVIAANLEGNDSAITVPPLTGINNAQTLYGTSGNLLGGGFDQMVIAAVNSPNVLSPGQIFFQVLAAADPTSATSGLIAGPVSAPFAFPTYGLLAITAGVFTDPQPEVPRPAAQIAVVTSAPFAGGTLVVTFYAVDSKLNVSQTQSITLTAPNGTSPDIRTVAIAAGRFSGGTHDQLAIAYPDTNGFVQITTVDFDGKGNATQKTNSPAFLGVQASDTSAPYPPGIYLAKGKFNWFSSSDQLGVSVGTSGESYVTTYSAIEVMSFDGSLNVTTIGSAYIDQQMCHFGLAAGRYDSMQTDPNTGAQVPNPNLQLADVVSDCGSGHTANIYDVDPNSFAVTLHSTKSIQSILFPGWPLGDYSTGNLFVSLVSGDQQGRSLMLGQPEKVTVAGHIQPDTVLGLPPMHVDWITPAGGGSPQILNVSVFPATFNTSYLFADTTNGAVTRSGTTSYTVATKETANEQLSYGVPGIADVSLQASQAATQLHKNVVSQKYNTYQGLSTTFTTSTTFDDVVAATGSQFNIYSYRVLGQCVPGNGPPSEGCTTGTVPLYIQFSGPDNVNYIQAAEGRNLEWYQPVQEPGNLFSYPATTAQLAADLGGGTGFQPLTATDTTWDSQTSAAVKTNWTAGGTNNVSAGSTSTHTFDASVSASLNVSFDGFGAGVGLGFDYNQSNSISTLNEMTSSFSNSQGINLNRGIPTGGDVNSEAYDYQGQSFVYGQTAPTGTVQTDATPPTTVQAQGYIAAAHLVDMMSLTPITSGAFWVQAYNAAPDVALNHPQRWIQKTPSSLNEQQVQFVCPYGFTSSLSSPQCTAATPSSPTVPAPTAISDDVFYEMKGLFITPGGTFNGPQIMSTTLGSQVNLRARVYNYSLKNFPSTATLHVQFYAQPWGAGQFATGANASTFAPAVFIGNGTTQSGDTTLPLPQAFCGGFQSSSVDPCTTSPGSTTNNWEYVYATWDTSKGGVTANSTWKFWVVAWVEDSGKLVSELPGHGLASLPAANVQFNSLADVPIETYSNNLGFYNQVFTVNPTVSQTTAAQTVLASASRTPAASTMKHLAIGNLTTRNSAPIVRDVPITIIAPHVASGDHVDSIMSLYYDGDPSKGGVLFDAQHISRVLLETPYLDTASYRATTCGQHKIFVRSIPLDGTAPVATASKTLKVTSDPVNSINNIIAYINKPGYPPRFRSAILSYLNAAKRSFTSKQTQAGTIQMQVLLNLVQGGAFFVPSDVQQILADQMKDLLGCL